MASNGRHSLFHTPPRIHNDAGRVRGVGFEFEFAGLDLHQAAEVVRRVFGGEHEVLSTFEHRVRTDVGDFRIEIDTSLLKDRKYEKLLRAVGLEPERMDTSWLENALLGTFSTVVPVEIGTPPLPVTELEPLDELRARLHEAKARGTRASILYAFGLHINPEIPASDAGEILNFLRAFLLLYPWVKQRAEVDISRRISPYINPFPDEYVRLVLREDYPREQAALIDDYLAHNPTRNRPLDLLPVLAHLDEQRVMRQVEDAHLVKPRPAFHYRLPNCMIDEDGWTVAREWNTWVAVERLAADRRRIADMSADYLRADRAPFKPFVDKWPAVLESYLEA